MKANSKMSQMLELAVKYFKVVIIVMHKVMKNICSQWVFKK